MAGYYELFAEVLFSAAHTLEGYQGDCAHLHGHNWRVRAYVRCERLDDMGMGIDFRTLKKQLQEVVSVFDHTHLNATAPFSRLHPTSENIARIIYEELGRRLNGERGRVCRVEVEETPGTGVGYEEN